MEEISTVNSFATREALVVRFTVTSTKCFCLQLILMELGTQTRTSVEVSPLSYMGFRTVDVSKTVIVNVLHFYSVVPEAEIHSTITAPFAGSKSHFIQQGLCP